MPLATPRPTPLLHVAGLTQTLSIGIGSAVASVRTLTDVSLTVAAGDCVVLAGGRGAGERALLAVIAGDRRGVTGTCDVDPTCRVRVLRIGRAAALALAHEWARAASIAASTSDADAARIANSHAHPAELFLLDVSDESRDRADAHAADARAADARAAPAEKPLDRAALLNWATLCTLRGGALVIAAGEALGVGLFQNALQQLQRPRPNTNTTATERDTRRPPSPRTPVSVRETPAASSRPAPSRHDGMYPVRVVVMHGGHVAPVIPLSTSDLANTGRHPTTHALT